MLKVDDRVKFAGKIISVHLRADGPSCVCVLSDNKDCNGNYRSKIFDVPELIADPIPGPAKTDLPKFKVGDAVWVKCFTGGWVAGKIDDIDEDGICKVFAFAIIGGGNCRVPFGDLEHRPVPEPQNAKADFATVEMLRDNIRAYQRLISTHQDVVRHRDGRIAELEAALADSKKTESHCESIAKAKAERIADLERENDWLERKVGAFGAWNDLLEDQVEFYEKEAEVNE